MSRRLVLVECEVCDGEPTPDWVNVEYDPANKYLVVYGPNDVSPLEMVTDTESIGEALPELKHLVCCFNCLSLVSVEVGIGGRDPKKETIVTVTEEREDG